MTWHGIAHLCSLPCLERPEMDKILNILLSAPESERKQMWLMPLYSSSFEWTILKSVLRRNRGSKDMTRGADSVDRKKTPRTTLPLQKLMQSPGSPLSLQKVYSILLSIPNQVTWALCRTLIRTSGREQTHAFQQRLQHSALVELSSFPSSTPDYQKVYKVQIPCLSLSSEGKTDWCQIVRR